ncbi:branched-chain-amino-acid aminotransferase 5 [Ophiobolus disseminans]|uniref:Branched-chain-amino-acid aminotransferase 5 n=1 Tax=Ophiobolus disseminans TaxID=1469910 RepID=A0A6A7ABY6_9PLEO|nr:branched-chain-amino-acid aminotransferase 5 [Ophiobolus disseminans]
MGAFPPAAVDSIDWSNVKDSKVYEVNGHIESTYSKADGKWSPLKFVASPMMQIHGMAPAINYGQQALEGLKAFRMPGEPGSIAIFRPDRNAARFQHSAEVLAMPAVSTDMFLKACRAAVALNAEFVPPYGSSWAMYLRPQLYGSSPHLGLTAPDQYTFCVFVVPTGMHLGTESVKALILDDFDRAAPRGHGHAKVGGNYAPVLRWSDQARSEGFGITLHLDSTRHEEVDEFSMCAFVGIISGEETTVVVPDSPNVIDSVMSNSVQEVVRSYGWTVEKRVIKYTELPAFSEVLGTGTAITLIPIRSIMRRKTRLLSAGPRVHYDSDANAETVTFLSEEDQSGGPIYKQLFGQLRALQTGDAVDTFGWRFTVNEQDKDLDEVQAL